MAPLQGLTALNNDKPPNYTDEGSLEARAIGPVNKGHGEYGGMDVPWPAGYGLGYDGTSYGPEVYQGHRHSFPEPGEPLDRTPDTHESPYPRGIIQPNLEEPGSYARAAYQIAVQRDELHGLDLGGRIPNGQMAPGGRETPVNYTVDRYPAPNQTFQAAIPGQIVSTGGYGQGRDTGPGGYGHLNDTDEFARGHSIRIIQHDRMPWDRSLDYAPPQPFWGRHEIAETRFDGPDSPYGIMGDTSTRQQIPWEGRIGDPTAYVQTPTPTVAPASDNSLDVWAYAGY